MPALPSGRRNSLIRFTRPAVICAQPRSRRAVSNGAAEWGAYAAALAGLLSRVCRGGLWWPSIADAQL